MKKTATLGKKERLKSRKLTNALFREGKTIPSSLLRIHYMFDPQSKMKLLFGAGVSKRYFKHAVDRNRIKRLIRESYRIRKNELATLIGTREQGLIIFFIYTGSTLPGHQQIMDAMDTALKKLTRTVINSR